MITEEQDSVQVAYATAYRHFEDGEFNQAVEYLLTIVKIDKHNIAAWQLLAKIFREEKCYHKSAACYRRLTKLKPDGIEYWINLGILRVISGEFAVAVDNFKQALAINNQSVPAWRGLSGAGYSFSLAEIEQFERWIGADFLGTLDLASLEFIIAKYHESQQQWQSAFMHLEKGNQLYRSMLHYDVDDEVVFQQRIASVYSSDYFKRQSYADPTPRTPVFIVGFPRSGTSLVEQILASHPQVFAAGEVLTISKIVSLLNEGDKEYLRYLNRVKALDQEQLNLFARTYLSYLPEKYLSKNCFTDKMPLNYQHLGLIALMFPNVKIINVKRDAVANCFACYKTLFGGGNEFCYAMTDLIAYYRAYEELLAHWHATLSNSIITVHYEELVADLAPQTERMLSFCQLDWSDDCLRFYETQRAVATASAMQVRKPVYSSSVDYWQNFADYIKPLMDLKP